MAIHKFAAEQHRMKRQGIAYLLSVIFISVIYIITASGCANIIPPSGGPKDTLPPVLLNAVPKDSATRFTGNKITLTFDEYVDVQSAFENVIVSPTPNNMPVINNSFRTISIKIRDTLEPKTTYAINFGNAIRDVNEGNVYPNFTYVFSTGDSLDDNTISGKVLMAETGKVDSTLIAVLHRNLDDSAVAKDKPRYIAKLDGSGNFHFRYLPAGTFALYVIPNEYSRHYDDSTKPFAFADKPINTTDNASLTLYAYSLRVNDSIAAARKPAPKEDKSKTAKDTILRIQTNLMAGRLDILNRLQLTFSKKITAWDSNKVVLADTFYKPLNNYHVVADIGGRFAVLYNWQPATPYVLIIQRNAFADSAGLILPRNDTLKFMSNRLEDYGSVRLRFNNLDTSKHPVLQIVQNEQVIEASSLTQREWYRKLYQPGDYDLRILYDRNQNGVWDPGRFFGVHIQPEIVVPLDTKLQVRANWDNEKDLTLKKE